MTGNALHQKHQSIVYTCISAHSKVNFWCAIVYAAVKNYKKTSMMWPSQNFLLYNEIVIKIKVNEWINSLKNILLHPPPLGDTYNLYKL